MRGVGLVLLLVLVSSAALIGQEKGAEPTWFPVRVGTVWHYRSGETKFEVRVASHEKAAGAPAARLETVKGGKVIATELVQVTRDGIYRLGVDLLKGDQKVTELAQPPILLLKLPPKKGESFSVDSKVEGRAYKGTFKIGEDEIMVPAGKFKTMVVAGQDLEVEGLKPALTTWYAENVGMVKQVLGAGDQKVVIELEKYEAGK